MSECGAMLYIEVPNTNILLRVVCEREPNHEVTDIELHRARVDARTIDSHATHAHVVWRFS